MAQMLASSPWSSPSFEAGSRKRKMTQLYLEVETKLATQTQARPSPARQASQRGERDLMEQQRPSFPR
jgi:hypothetical protein